MALRVDSGLLFSKRLSDGSVFTVFLKCIKFSAKASSYRTLKLPDTNTMLCYQTDKMF